MSAIPSGKFPECFKNASHNSLSALAGFLITGLNLLCDFDNILGLRQSHRRCCYRYRYRRRFDSCCLAILILRFMHFAGGIPAALGESFYLEEVDLSTTRLGGKASHFMLVFIFFNLLPCLYIYKYVCPICFQVLLDLYLNFPCNQSTHFQRASVQAICFVSFCIAFFCRLLVIPLF